MTKSIAARRAGAFAVLTVSSVLVVVAACSTPAGDGTEADGSSTSSSPSPSDWSISDLCEQADFSGLRAVLPSWGPPKSTASPHSDVLGDMFECLIPAGQTEELVGALKLRASVGQDVSGHFGDFSSPSRPVPNLGMQAAIAVDDAGGSIQLDVLDGALRFRMTWILPGHDLPEGLADAMIATARATIVRLRSNTA